MVTAYYDMASRRIIHQVGLKASLSGFAGIRPSLLILHGMLVQTEVVMVEPRFRYETTEDQRFPDLAPIYALEKMDQYGPNDEEKLIQNLNGFTEYVIPHSDLYLDSESVYYIRENLGRVIDYLVPKLRNGHLWVYKLRYGKSPEENGAMVFLDLSNPRKPVLLYPAFGLQATSSGSRFVQWKPGHDETYEPEPDSERIDAQPPPKPMNNEPKEDKDNQTSETHTNHAIQTCCGT